MALKPSDCDIQREHQWMSITPWLAKNAQELLDWYVANVEIKTRKGPETLDRVKLAQASFLLRLSQCKWPNAPSYVKGLLRSAAACPEFCRVRISMAWAIAEYVRIKRREADLARYAKSPIIPDALVESTATSFEKAKKRERRERWEKFNDVQTRRFGKDWRKRNE